MGIEETTRLEEKAARLIKTGDWADIYPGLTLLDIKDAAILLCLPQTVVLQWIGEGKLLALRNSAHQFRIPVDTLMDRRAAIPGMAHVINEICKGYHNLAWLFLIQPVPDEDGLRHVIDLLKEGDMDRLDQAALIWHERLETGPLS